MKKNRFGIVSAQNQEQGMQIFKAPFRKEQNPNLHRKPIYKEEIEDPYEERLKQVDLLSGGMSENLMRTDGFKKNTKRRLDYSDRLMDGHKRYMRVLAQSVVNSESKFRIKNSNSQGYNLNSHRIGRDLYSSK